MAEFVTSPPVPLAGSPPLPPRIIQRLLPPLPPRRQATLPVRAATEQRETTERRLYTVSSWEASSVNASGSHETQSTTVKSIAAERVTTTESASIEIGAASSTPITTIHNVPAQSTTPSSSQNAPKLPSLMLSLLLREPLERSHGRISTITAIQSFFKSVPIPAAPPFEYSTLVDHALLAGQLTLHDPAMRQTKRLPLVITASIGAFLVAATGVIPRYFGWAMLVAATWFGPGRFLLSELWYISVGLAASTLFIDVFPMLSLSTLLWTGVIAVSKALETRGFDGNNGRKGQVGLPLLQGTVGALQNGSDIKPVALDVLQNVTEWWTYRQSEPERKRRAEAKAAKETKIADRKIEKRQRAETQKEMKKARIDEKEVERLRKQDEELELKRVKTEEKEAERLRKFGEDTIFQRTKTEHFEAEEQRKITEETRRKEEEMTLKRAETERLEAEKQRRKDEEMALKRFKSEEKEAEKQRKRELELELKRFKIEENEVRKRKEIEERERLKQEKLELRQLRNMQEEETRREKARLKEITKMKKAELAALAQKVPADVDPSSKTRAEIRPLDGKLSNMALSEPHTDTSMLDMTIADIPEHRVETGSSSITANSIETKDEDVSTSSSTE
jgi:hypothetical protein